MKLYDKSLYIIKTVAKEKGNENFYKLSMDEMANKLVREKEIAKLGDKCRFLGKLLTCFQTDVKKFILLYFKLNNQ